MYCSEISKLIKILLQQSNLSILVGSKGIDFRIKQQHKEVLFVLSLFVFYTFIYLLHGTVKRLPIFIFSRKFVKMCSFYSFESFKITDAVIPFASTSV